MKIAFRKISDQRHALEIEHDDGRRERVECETRSYLLHDFLHYAVEREAGIERGFWGSLASGKSLAQLNDKAQPSVFEADAEIATVERMVGMLHGAAKGQAAEAVVAAIGRYAETSETSVPPWLTEDFVRRVQERLRQVMGRWRATAYGECLWLEWP